MFEQISSKLVYGHVVLWIRLWSHFVSPPRQDRKEMCNDYSYDLLCNKLGPKRVWRDNTSEINRSVLIRLLSFEDNSVVRAHVWPHPRSMQAVLCFFHKYFGHINCCFSGYHVSIFYLGCNIPNAAIMDYRHNCYCILHHDSARVTNVVVSQQQTPRSNRKFELHFLFQFVW